MPDQPVSPLDALQAQLRGVLDQQLAALKAHYEEEVASARRQAAAEAERQLAARLESVRTEWTKRLETEVGAARKDGERKATEAAAEQARQELEQAVNSARRTAELELESERRRRQNDVDAERDRGKQELEAERARAKQELDTARERAEQELSAVRTSLGTELDVARATAARAAQAVHAVKPGAGDPRAVERLTAALQEIDSGTALTHALDALLKHAGSHAGRAALFFVNGDRLKAWKGIGIPDVDLQTVESSIDGRDLLARAIQTGQPTRATAELPAPPFSRLAADRDAAAVPLIVGGKAVTVLYLDNGGGESISADAWLPAVGLLARHTSAVLALRTATRTLELFGGTSERSGAPAEPADDQSARRYARLLVSEIKLYNEGAVRAGRQQHDLLQRLRSEIDRARRLYEERVPAAVGARHLYFQQELVHTLADGDPALLGSA